MQPCTSASFSAASVGPKSAYRSRTSDNARSRYASGRRLLLGRPRRFETRPAAPPFFKPASNRKTCRRFRSSSSQASATRRRPDRTPSRTSSRSNSFLLIDTTVIAHPQGPSNLGQCHVNFAEGCHLYIAATVCRRITAIVENGAEDAFWKSDQGYLREKLAQQPHFAGVTSLKRSVFNLTIHQFSAMVG